MKFKHIKAVCALLADIAFYTTSFPTIDVVCAVPLHPRRKNNRGFDQAECIAKKLADHLQVTYLPLLKRVHYHTPQSSIASKEKRATRLAGAYAINQKDFLVMMHHLYQANPTKKSQKISVLLIDDVYTTGATMGECKKTLFSATEQFGIELVIHEFCIARG